MFTAKVREKSKNLTFKVAVAIFTFLSIVILGPGLFNLDSGQALAESSGGCKTIALDARIACSAEVNDDYWIAIGNCNNIPDSGERADCKQDAGDERKEALEECADQLEARRALCEALGEKYYNPVIDPTKFVHPKTITKKTANPYFPLVHGYKWRYHTIEDGEVTETIIVKVTDQTIEIEGVPCVVVRDTVYEGDSTEAEDILEDTYDWYGQKINGTVWYFGEFSLSKEECEPEELCEGLFSEDGSWKSGYSGDKAGRIMFAPAWVRFTVGRVYRQELSLGNAEDAGKVLSVGGDVTLPVGRKTYLNVVQTLDFTPIDPTATEEKFYAPGVGTVLEVGLEDGVPTGEVVELVSKNF